MPRAPRPAAATDPLLDFLSDPHQARLQIVSGRGHYLALRQVLEQARLSVWIASANVKDLWVAPCGPCARPGRRGQGFVSVLEVLDELAGRGVELRLLHAKLPSLAFRRSFDRHHRLVRGGLAMRLCPRVHLKVVIVDGTVLYFGSANWTGAGLGAKGAGRRNFELGLLTEDPLLLDQVQAIYDHLWRGLACASCQLQEVCEDRLDHP